MAKKLIAATKSNIYRFHKYNVERRNQTQNKTSLTKMTQIRYKNIYIRQKGCRHPKKTVRRWLSESQEERPQKTLRSLEFLASRTERK